MTNPLVALKSAPAALRALRRRRKAQGRGSRTTLALLALLALELGAFAWALATVFSSGTGGGRSLSLDELADYASRSEVSTAVLHDADDRVTGDLTTGSRYYVDIPSSGPLTSDLTKTLQKAGAQVTVDKQSGKQQLRLVTTFLLPLLILATVFALLLSPGGRKGGALGGVADFSTVRSGRVKKGTTSAVGFGNAGGVDEAIAELQEVVDYLKDPTKYEALGAAPPKGLLLFGPPGTGKTLLARAVAGEAGVPFFSVAGAEFVEALVGVGAARVRDLFARVRAAAPAIVFIDELDAAGRKRGASSSGGGSDEREQTLNQLLVEMDGFDSSKGIVVIGATNRPDILDPALMRPGRFDRHITIERPDPEGRLRILEIHANGKPLDPEVDLERIAQQTPGFTGADLANVMNEAALLTIRDSRTTVTVADVDEAIRRVLEGPKRRGHLLTAAEKERAATHEAGHVVVSLGLGMPQPLHRVSLLGGKAVATTELRSDDEEAILTEDQLKARLAVLMGGTAAELVAFGGTSTGVERDLESATSLARDMVARYGMAAGLEHIRLLGPDSAAYLGDDTPWGDIADETKAAADVAIRRLLTEAVDTATALLRQHVKALTRVSDELQAAETLEGDALEAVLEQTRTVMANTGSAARPRRSRTSPA